MQSLYWICVSNVISYFSSEEIVMQNIPREILESIFLFIVNNIEDGCIEELNLFQWNFNIGGMVTFPLGLRCKKPIVRRLRCSYHLKKLLEGHKYRYNTKTSKLYFKIK